MRAEQIFLQPLKLCVRYLTLRVQFAQMLQGPRRFFILFFRGEQPAPDDKHHQAEPHNHAEKDETPDDRIRRRSCARQFVLRAFRPARRTPRAKSAVNPAHASRPEDSMPIVPQAGNSAEGGWASTGVLT